VGLLFREQGKQRAQRCFPALFDLASPSARRNPIAGVAEICRDIKIASEISVRGFRMFLQICFYERANGDDLQLVEMGIVKGGTNQLVAQPASAPRFRDLSMNQGDAVLRAMVLQNSALISKRDLKLTLRFVMRYGTAVHTTLLLRFFLQILRDCRHWATISSDATFAPRAAATPASQVP
jgi:hypothetical protein